MSKLRNLTLFGITMGMMLTFTALANRSDAKSAELTGVPVIATQQNHVEGKVNLNSADIATLHTIKGIGPKKAQAIVDFRSANGAFKSVDDVLKIKCRGINKKWLDKIREHLTV